MELMNELKNGEAQTSTGERKADNVIEIAKTPAAPKQKILMIGTPAYGNQVHIDYVKTLIQTLSIGISWNWLALGNESLITRARNNLISTFYHNKSFDKLLFLDADVFVSGEGIKAMCQGIDSGKHVVGAAVRLKAHQKVYNFNPGDVGTDAIGRPMFKTDPTGRYIDARWLGTACIMLDREAVNYLVEKAKSKGDVYDKNSIMSGGDLNVLPEYYDIFKVGVGEKAQKEYLATNGEKKGIYMSEDFYMCQELVDGGFNIWVDTQVKTVHHGNLDFEA